MRKARPTNASSPRAFVAPGYTRIMSDTITYIHEKAGTETFGVLQRLIGELHAADAANPSGGESPRVDAAYDGIFELAVPTVWASSEDTTRTEMVLTTGECSVRLVRNADDRWSIETSIECDEWVKWSPPADIADDVQGVIVEFGEMCEAGEDFPTPWAIPDSGYMPAPRAVDGEPSAHEVMRRALDDLHARSVKFLADYYRMDGFLPHPLAIERMARVAEAVHLLDGDARRSRLVQAVVDDLIPQHAAPTTQS
jgi:hypothetical protein